MIKNTTRRYAQWTCSRTLVSIFLVSNYSLLILSFDTTAKVNFSRGTWNTIGLNKENRGERNFINSLFRVYRQSYLKYVFATATWSTIAHIRYVTWSCFRSAYFAKSSYATMSSARLINNEVITLYPQSYMLNYNKAHHHSLLQRRLARFHK